MTEDTNYDLTQILTDGMGIKGIKNKVIATITKTIYSKALNHFGIQVYSDNYNESYDMIKVIKKFDKHNKIKLKYKCIYIINSTYLLKMRSDTYILISGHEDTNRNYKLYIYFFGKKCYDYYDYFHKELCKNDNSSTNVFNISYSSADPRGWKCIMNNVASRSFDTLFFDNNIEDDIKKFLNNWINNEDIFRKRGLLFKTGLLLYGNPGTGKSSIANAIASYLDCNMITIDMTNFANLDIASITTTINTDSARYVILLDEIDVLFSNRDESNSKDQNEAISKLLLLLDSVQSPDNVVFVSTTNYIDRLDPALIRKGRFDKKLEIGNISGPTAAKMCRSFGLTDQETNKLLNNKSDIYNPASLQADILEAIKSHLQND